MLIFVTGGVRSGKSSFAEKLAIKQVESNHLHYVATSMDTDTEMHDRIHRHKERREASSAHWITWEVERNIGRLHEKIAQNSIILFDCLTTLVNNELFKLNGENYDMLNENERKALFNLIIGSIHKLQHRRTLIVVSNEVFYEPFKRETTFAYVELLGKIHQRLVALSDEAYLCENGISIRMK